MNKLHINFSKNDLANKAIDVLFRNRVKALEAIEDKEEHFKAELCIKQDAAYIASFLTLWFSYTTLESPAAYGAVLNYLKDVTPLPLNTIPVHRLLIWEKLFDEKRIKSIIGQLRIESTLLEE